MEYIDGQPTKDSEGLLVRPHYVCDIRGWNRATIRDLAAFAVQASPVSFTGIGSLVPPEQDDPSALPHVGRLHVPRISYKLKEGSYLSTAELFYAMIDRSLGHFSKQTGIETAKKNLGKILECLDIRDMISMCPALLEEGPTYLKHADLKPNVFLLKPDGSLAGIIDWEL